MNENEGAGQRDSRERLRTPWKPASELALGYGVHLSLLLHHRWPRSQPLFYFSVPSGPFHSSASDKEENYPRDKHTPRAG